MILSISDAIRGLIATLPDPEVVKKYKPNPKIKPPRRRPSVKNKTDQSDYMKNYMQDYRGEGKDYQKVPDKVKEMRRELKKKLQSP